jgi:hypothetical protein
MINLATGWFEIKQYDEKKSKHYLLCHPGIIRTEETIGQHFYWPKMREQITNSISTCMICQTQKNQSKSMDFSQKKMQKQCHRTDYASISLVHTIYKAT